MGAPALVCLVLLMMVTTGHLVRPPRREALGATFVYRGQARPLSPRKLVQLKIRYPWTDNKVPPLPELEAKKATCHPHSAQRDIYCEEISALHRLLADARGLRLSLNNQYWSIVLDSFTALSPKSHIRSKRHAANAPAQQLAITAAERTLGPALRTRSKRQLQGLGYVFSSIDGPDVPVSQRVGRPGDVESVYAPHSESRPNEHAAQQSDSTLFGSSFRYAYNILPISRIKINSSTNNPISNSSLEFVPLSETGSSGSTRRQRISDFFVNPYDALPISESKIKIAAAGREAETGNCSHSREKRQLDALDIVYNSIGLASEDQVSGLQAQQRILVENERELRGKIAQESVELSEAITTLGSRDDAILAAVETEFNETLSHEQNVFGNLTDLLKAHMKIRTLTSLIIQQNEILISGYDNIVDLLVQVKLKKPLTALYRYSNYSLTYADTAQARVNISFHREYIQLNLSVPNSDENIEGTSFWLYSFMPLMIRTHPKGVHYAFPRPDHEHLAINAENYTVPLTTTQLDMCLNNDPACGSGWMFDIKPTACIEGLFLPRLLLVKQRCRHRLISDHAVPSVQIVRKGIYLLSNVPRVKSTCMVNGVSEVTTTEIVVDSTYKVACHCFLTSDYFQMTLLPGNECDSVTSVQDVISLNLYLPLIDLTRHDWDELAEAIANGTSTLRITLPRLKTLKAEHALLKSSDHDLDTISRELLEPIEAEDLATIQALMQNLTMPVLLKLLVCLAVALGILNLTCWCLIRRRVNSLTKIILPGILHTTRADSDLWKPAPASSEDDFDMESIISLNTYLLVFLMVLLLTAICIRAVSVCLSARKGGWTKYRIFLVVSNMKNWVELKVTTFRPSYLINDQILVTHLHNLPRISGSGMQVQEAGFRRYKLKIAYGSEESRHLKLNSEALIVEELPTEISISRNQFDTLSAMINDTERIKMRFYAVRGKMMMIPVKEEIRIAAAAELKASDKRPRSVRIAAGAAGLSNI